MKITGRWRIVDMELWEQEDVDLLGPAFINFARDRSGSFRFLAVEGWMDCRDAPRDGRPGAEFTWDGNDEGDRTSGRGWVTLEGDILVGRIYIHLGDDSAFRAVRAGGSTGA